MDAAGSLLFMLTKPKQEGDIPKFKSPVSFQNCTTEGSQQYSPHGRTSFQLSTNMLRTRWLTAAVKADSAPKVPNLESLNLFSSVFI